MVAQPCHRDLEVDEELGVRAAPTQFQAAGGDVRDVQHIRIWGGQDEVVSRQDKER